MYGECFNCEYWDKTTHYFQDKEHVCRRDNSWKPPDYLCKYWVRECKKQNVNIKDTSEKIRVDVEEVIETVILFALFALFCSAFLCCLFAVIFAVVNIFKTLFS